LVIGDLSPQSSSALQPRASNSITDGCDRSQTAKALTGQQHSKKIARTRFAG
jgi:hypothetical protein